MSQRHSPRPPYDRPTPIPRSAVTRYVWGDRGSGEVADWIYVSSEKVHLLVFGMPPGGCFRHSEIFPTVFAADEVYHVLSGTLVLNNPQTGEVHGAGRGESIFFRRDTWHHGYSFGAEPLRVLEFFAPPPAQGAAGEYARKQPNLTQPRTGEDSLLGRWPLARDEAARGRTMRVLREPDLLLRLEGPAQEALVELFVSTEHLTVGRMTLLPGRQSDVRTYGGDLALYLSTGELFVRAGGEEEVVGELKPEDGFYLPAGAPVQFFNYGGEPCRFLFGVAPAYLPSGAG